METNDLTMAKRSALKNSFTYSFESAKSPEEIYDLLLDIDKWWSGIHNESITGKSDKINDEFSFSAGGGAHYSKQKLVELIPNKRIVWLVSESHLSYLTDADEWENTRLCFDIYKDGDITKVTFTHDGLVPKIECYDSCTNAWTQYFEKLKAQLK